MAAVGDRVSGYELQKLVAEGRTGQVFQALQPRLERIVALKIVRPELVVDDASRERFRREMRAAASIDHPGIVPVYEVGEEGGALFAAMRWVDGGDLGGLLAERGRLEPAQAVRIVGRVAAALEAAHGVGLFHGNLEASDILLEGDRVYLTGFGFGAGAEGAADSRADVAALGRIAREMLGDGLSPEIDSVLHRASAADPTDRYRTPARLAEAVEGALAQSGLDREGPPRRGRRRLLAIGAAAALVVAAVVIVLLPTGGGEGPTQATDTGGRALPAASTLPACGKTFSGPPRECRSKTGGFEAITDVGRPLRLATMDFTVDRVRQATRLTDSNGAAFTAPAGIRFVVIDATITNLTDEAEEFEPDNLTVGGRETALWLFDKQDKIVAYRGHDGDDYSVQYDTVLGTLQAPLAKVELLPHVPYSGQMVFHYPIATLDADRRAILEVHELGHGFRYAKSLGGVRLNL